MPDRPAPILSLSNLCIDVRTETGWLSIVDDVGLDLPAGRTLALVGESGSGKTLTALAIMRLLGRTGRVSGRVLLDGTDLPSLSERAMRAIRGRRIAMIFQEPMTSLNPLMSVGRQIVEAVETHTDLRGAAAWSRTVEMLEQVGIADAGRRAIDYPHRFSGGMRQRVMIAMALACEPAVLIADEPTTALDVTVQAQVLGLLRDIQRKTGLAILLITHDLAVVAQFADAVAVMYAGRLVERGAVADVISRPAHPYTQALLACLPTLGSPARRLAVIEGGVPSPGDMPVGCRFEPRCRLGHGDRKCVDRQPDWTQVATAHDAACWKVTTQ